MAKMSGHNHVLKNEDVPVYPMSFSIANYRLPHFTASRGYRWIIGIALFTGLFRLWLYQNVNPLPERSPPTPFQAMAGVDWSRFAYTQYVTNSIYLCNSVIFFERLHRLSSRADRVMMYPFEMLQPENAASNDARLLLKARNEYNVKLVPINVQYKDGVERTWSGSFTKLLAFNQTQYSRVLSTDSDSILLQDMDELFLLPSAPVAMPRAYWLFPDNPILSSHIILIEPSEVEFARIMDEIKRSNDNDFDMEIVNYLYGANALVLPHRPYAMLTGEFRSEDHSMYLGTDHEKWDPVAAYNEAKLIHFSDWPLPKPWVEAPEDVHSRVQPKCYNTTEGLDCTSRMIWNSIYSDFKNKRKEVCE